RFLAVIMTAQRSPAPVIEPAETPTPVPSIEATTPSPVPTLRPKSSGIETPSRRKSLAPAKPKTLESPVADGTATTNNAPARPLTLSAGDDHVSQNSVRRAHNRAS